MPDLDLGPAIEAAAKAAYSAATGGRDWGNVTQIGKDMWLRESRAAIEGALPELRKAIAEELKEFARQAAKTDSPDAILGLLTASVIVSGQRFDSYEALADQLDELVRGQSGGGDG